MITATSLMFFPILRKVAPTSARDRGRRSSGVLSAGLATLLVVGFSLLQGPAIAGAQTAPIPLTGECATPCVEVTCEGPPQACDGEVMLIQVTAFNCSQGFQNITIEVIGPDGVPIQFDFFGVGPGASVDQQVPVDQRCNGAGGSTVTVTAIATNDCGDTVTAQSDCLIECGFPPCVDVICVTPPQGCSGQDIPLQGQVFNCSNGPEDIHLTFSGPNGPLGSVDFLGVGPGEGVAYEQFVTLECQLGTAAQYFVEALATNECGEALDTAECLVECGPAPCVAVACDTPPRVCPGAEFPLTAIATNCGENTVDIAVTSSGPSGTLGTQLFESVPPGADVFYEQIVIQECESGAAVQYIVEALATNDCGEAFAIDECLVECGSEPCLEISCSASETAMDGDPVVIDANVINCSGDIENVVVRFYNPDGEQICEHLLANVAPGQIVGVSCTDIAQCPEPTKLIYRVVAEAVNSCGSAAAECEVVVSCEPPVPTRIKLFELGDDENGIRLVLEVQDATAVLSAVIHRGVTEDLRYALPITPEPIPFTGTALEFVDETVEPGTKYWYWIEVREDGRTVVYAGPIAVVAPEPGASVTFVAPAQPNPTSTSAVFRYSIGSDVAGQGEVKVSLAIYDSRGRLVRTLVNGRQSVGEYRASWDGRSERGGRVPAGVYYYRFRAGVHSEHSSLVITR